MPEETTPIEDVQEFFEEDPDLGRTALEAGELLDALDGFGDRGGRMLPEVRLQGVVIVLQVAGGPMKLQACERLYASALILLEVAAHGIFTDPDAGANLVVRQPLGLQQQRFHLPLHTWVRMVIALIFQFLDVCFAKR